MIQIKYIIRALFFVFIAVSLSGCFHNKSGSATANLPTPIVGTPTADAGIDQDVAIGSMVTLDGSGSSDSQNDAVTYIWTQTGGPDVTSSSGNLTGETPSFTAPVNNVSTVQFSLVVSNGTNNSTADSVQINVMEDPYNAFFVDGDNGSDISGTGSRGSPFASIGMALSAGGMILPPDVYVQSRSTGASYVEPTTLQAQNGTSLYGGFDSSWVRNTRGNRTVISGASTAIDFSNIGSDTWLSGFEITASSPALAGTVVRGVNVAGGTAVLYLQDNIITTNNTAAGASVNSASNYGVKVVGLFGLVITDNTVTSGNAGTGSNAPAAIPGTNALNNAMQGGPGAATGMGGGLGGAGGINPSNSVLNGGAGGNGGGTTYFGQPGGGSYGGNAGSLTLSGGNATAGANGASGAPSTTAGNGYGSVFAGSFARSSGIAGSPGNNGTPGSGGGGGGGGILIGIEGSGGGGGGGGGAGSGGRGGPGGIGGSASIGVFVLNTTNLTMNNNTVTAGNGGDAGNGSYGGSAGLGATGRMGGGGGLNSGNGGYGSAGGNGGNGGDGAGGGGGPSFAIYLDNILAFNVIGNSAQSGTGGPGGSANSGTAGDGGFSYGLFTNNLASGTGPAMDAANSLTGGTGGTGGISVGPDGSDGTSGGFIDF